MEEKSLVEFRFEEKGVRVIKDSNGEPWFVAKDVCKVLEILNVSQAVENLDDDEKLIYVLNISGQNREVWAISESGLYVFIIRSNKKEAKRFRKWVTSEVLPAIRKTGEYRRVPVPVPTLNTLEMIIQSAQHQLMLERRTTELEGRVKAIENRPVVNAVIEYFTILGHCRNIKKQVGEAEARKYGFQCKKICEGSGYVIGSVPDTRYGRVNTYPLDVLIEVIGS